MEDDGLSPGIKMLVHLCLSLCVIVCRSLLLSVIVFGITNGPL